MADVRHISTPEVRFPHAPFGWGLYDGPMDLATTHLSADLDGLASLVALSLVEGPVQLVLPGSMDVADRKSVV